jgi:hypothetical protein
MFRTCGRSKTRAALDKHLGERTGFVYLLICLLVFVLMFITIRKGMPAGRCGTLSNTRTRIPEALG